MDEFINRALVARLLRAEIYRRRFRRFHHRHRMRGVRGATQEIKLGRVFRVVALEPNGLRSHRQINAIQFLQRESLVIRNHPPCSADVDDAHLTTFEKKRAPCLLMIRQINRRQRHRAADHEPIQIGKRASDFTGNEKIVDEKRVTKFLRGHADNVLRMRHPAD